MAEISIEFGRRLVAFVQARKAIAAVEFTIIMPMLLAFVLGGAEVARFVNFSRAINSLAYSQADLVASRPAGATNLVTNDIIFGEEATPLIFPDILSDAARKGYNSNNQAWMNDIQFTISSVTFTPTIPGCTSNCIYAGVVTWSYANNASKRSCIIPPLSVSNTSAPSLTTLPQGVYTSGTLIVVDIAFQYTPIFGGGILQPALIRRSAYLQPRYNSAIYYSGVPSC